MNLIRVVISTLIAMLSFGLVVNDVKEYPKLTGDEVIPCTGGVLYLGGRQSPGDQIGTTWYDLQADGASYGQRIRVDDYNQAHIDWMKMDAGAAVRFCAWNARYANGTYFGETQAAPTWSGYVQIDVSRDVNPDSQRSVISYHYQALSYIDIDAGNLSGNWPNAPKTPNDVDWEWPKIAVASNNNIIMVTQDYNASIHHVYLTTDQGNTWTYQGVIGGPDSCLSESQFVRASRNPGSHKVVHTWTQSIGLEYAGYLISQMADNVHYRLSTDDGVTWGAPVRVTNYTPPITMANGDSTPWAFCHVNAVFDNNDNLHIAWGAHLGWKQSDTLYYGERAKIFHWDEVSNTVTTVNSPSTYYPEPEGWWLQRSVGNPSGEPGAWRIQADHPQLVVGNADTLYCLWHGNDDTTDVSAAGYNNGEFYGAYSPDNGLTWSNYVNLTNTRSPGAPAGECMDEDYMTANPFIVNDSIFITYVEDKDAGSYPHGEGVGTENPVRCWVFPTSLIVYGVEEENKNQQMKPENLKLEIHPNPFSTLTKISVGIGQSAEGRVTNTLSTMPLAPCVKIYDATGRLVKTFSLHTTYYILPTISVEWNGTDDSGHKLPSGVYFVQMEVGGKNISEKIIKLK